ncbi:MAG TPA: tripartite tricarboxylate transporter substrate binding protein [Burkholderiales bacterium]|nr:tripartite tricarboxylate transporter substrate binding protein [Burkholderiales bacterium]
MDRRVFLAAGLCGAAASAWPQAGAYPSHPIRIIVPFAAGGGGDFVTRLLAGKLAGLLGASIVVENRTGASGNIGTEAALKSAPDGYTLLTISGTYASQIVASRLAFDPFDAITPLTQLTQESTVIVVNGRSPIASLKDLIERAKAAPGKISYGSAGTGGLAHLETEFFAAQVGIRLNHIPYRGTASALNDLLAGQIDMAFGSTSSMAAHVRAGRLRALVITGAARSRSLPEVPTFADLGMVWSAPLLWHAMLAPKGLPAPIAERLVPAITEALFSREVSERLLAENIEPMPGGPEKLMALIRNDAAQWQQVARIIGLKPE